MRSEVLLSDEEASKDPKTTWQTESPYDTRQLAIKDAVTAYKSAMTNKKRGHIQQFHLGFKSRKQPSQIFWIDYRAIKKVKKKEPKHKKGVVSQPTSQKDWLQIFPARLGPDK